MGGKFVTFDSAVNGMVSDWNLDRIGPIRKQCDWRSTVTDLVVIGSCLDP